MRWCHNPFDDITSGKYHSSNLPGQISARINVLFMYGNRLKRVKNLVVTHTKMKKKTISVQNYRIRFQ